MNDVKAKTNSRTKKIIIITVAAVVFIALLVFFFTCLFPPLLHSGFFDHPPNKTQLIELVLDNEDTFDDAIDYIKTLDSNEYYIDSLDGKIYTLDLFGATITQIQNTHVEKILNLGVEYIYLDNNSAMFYCGNRGGEYYTGIIYSNGGAPISTDLDNSIKGHVIRFSKKGDGWEWQEENGDSYYYCERIIGNWFYYQRWW